MSSGSHLSKDLYDLIKSIGETKSKEQQDRIIQNELVQLKPQLSKANIQPKKMKELLIRALYIEMLGYNAEFAYIHAVNLTQSKNLVLKRMGYLLCSLFFNQDSELLIMLISTIQKDLASTNIHQIIIGLTALTKLMNSSIVGSVADAVLKLINHQTDLVRKKTLLVIEKIQRVSPTYLSEYNEKMKKGLCDREPSVMAAALNMYFTQTKASPQKYKELTSSFVIILKQVIEHKLPKEFDYHRSPSPWIQVKLMQVLGFLGQNDQKASQHIYEILSQALRRAQDSTNNIGFALVFQCVLTAAKLYPQQGLLTEAASCISKFLQSTSANLKYLGIRAMGEIFKSYPKIMEQHQMMVVDCLESKDETLKKLTLDLLYKITNGSNIEVISKKMLTTLHSSTDAYFRQNLVNRICELAERFAPSHQWYIDTMHILFEFGSEYISLEVLNNYLKLVADNFKEDNEFGALIIQSNMSLLERVQPTDLIIKMVSWIFGEIGSNVYGSDSEQLQQIAEVLIKSLTIEYEDKNTKVWVLNALAKISSSKGFQMHKEVKSVLEEYSASNVISVSQRAMEYRKLAKYNAALRISGSINFDPAMPFLKGFVDEAKKKGAKEYQSGMAVNKMPEGLELKFAPYVMNRDGKLVSTNPKNSEDSELKLNVPEKWNNEGYTEETKRQNIKGKSSLTTISNFKGGFGSQQLSFDAPNDGPTNNFATKSKEPVVDIQKQKLANSLFQQVLNPASKFKGPEVKKKNPDANPKPVSKPAAPSQPQPQVQNKPAKGGKKPETADLLDLL